MNKCSKCKKLFATDESFNTHACVKQAMAEDPATRLKRMLDEGTITKVYYNHRMKEFSK
jgi:acetyl-CoA carboxylase beta subunit